jgi:hypothetical protein
MPDTKTGWPTDCRSLYNFDFYFGARNQWQVKIGEDLGKNQPDTLSGFIELHWRAHLIMQASVKSKQSQQSS